MRQDTKRRLHRLEDSVQLLTRLMENPTPAQRRALNEILEDMLTDMRELAEEHARIAHIYAVHAKVY